MININKFKITERPECSADTKLFFDDVNKSGTRGKKQQVDVLQYGRSLLSKCAGYTQYFLSDVYTNSTQTKKAQVETVQCGRSMIEMLGVLAIVGVLSVGGIAGYSKAMEKFKINKTIDQITHIATNIRTLYSQQTSYDGLNTSNAIKMGAIPSDMGSSNEYAITNPFNGDAWVGYAPDTNNDHKFFAIVYEGLSKNACTTLSTMDWGSSHSSGLIGLAVGSDTIYSEAWKYNGHWHNLSIETNCNKETSVYSGVEFCAKKLPLNVARAAQLCDCPNNTCNLVLIYE